jgi:uncharacterized protein
MKIEIEEATPEDIRLAHKQCGNMQIYGVAARCPYGVPQVVVLNPILNKETNVINYAALANLVWLSCPYLHDKITELEKKGMIERAQNLLHHNRAIATMMNDAHAHFYYFRKELLRRLTGRTYAEEETPYFDAGIGGVKDFQVVKCLHLHYAHYAICPVNMVGRSVETLLEGSQYAGCSDRRCLR